MKKKKENNLNTKGITLIALVITIIVLLILAGVSIAMLTGQNGILTQANKSKIEQSHGAVKEAISLAYNEWQIEVNTGSRTKLASTETVIINGEEEKAKAGTEETFLQFLESKGYIKEGTTDVLEVERLTGSKQALGNGEDTDIYKIELKDGNYEVNYYDKNGETRNIWSIASKDDSQESATLEPDTGKEALILVYRVRPGDTIELPYFTTYYDGENEQTANFDFTVDWGDGTKTENITNENIEKLATHTYNNLNTEKEIKISIMGIYEYLNYSLGTELIEVEQWGTTKLKGVSLSNAIELRQIATPTESSFKDLIVANFEYSGITSIPEKLFANCPNVISFDGTFEGTKIASIPENLFANCPNVISFDGTFEGTKITSIPENLFANCPNAIEFNLTFGETEITSIPENLFANLDLKKEISLKYCFTDCKNLKGNAPELWKKGTNSEENYYRGNPDGEGCFAGSEGLENYIEIPEYWKTLIPQ